MKIIITILTIAFLIITSVMVSLIRRGGALKPAGLIKPTELGVDPTVMGRQIALRLFPDFSQAKQIIWRVEGGAEELADIARVAFAHFQSPGPRTLHDLRLPNQDECAENCWYIQDLASTAPDAVQQKLNEGPTAEVFIQYFDRDEKVPEACDVEKILDVQCMRPVSVREVHRKLKTSAPVFFMQRYQKAQFYLFIEKNKKN